jgi:outer membrane protein assembly factor BamB
MGNSSPAGALTVGQGLIVGPMLVSNGVVLGQDGTAKVNALDADTGKLKWSLLLTSGSPGWAAAANGTTAVISSVSTQGGDLLIPGTGASVDLLTGQPTPGNLLFLSTSSPIFGTTRSYTVNAEYGTLSALNLANNNIDWSFQATDGTSLAGPPLLINGVIYVTSRAPNPFANGQPIGGGIFAVSEEGQQLWADPTLNWLDPQQSLLGQGFQQAVFASLGYMLAPITPAEKSLSWSTLTSDGNVLVAETQLQLVAYGN